MGAIFRRLSTGFSQRWPSGHRASDAERPWRVPADARQMARQASSLRGTLRASLDRSRRFRSGILRISAEGDNGDSGVTGGSGGSLSGSDESELRDEISFYLSRAVVGLVGA